MHEQEVTQNTSHLSKKKRRSGKRKTKRPTPQISQSSQIPAPIDSPQDGAKSETIRLLPLAPAHQTRAVPLGSSVWMGSNSVHLLLKQGDYLCLLDQELKVVKEILWLSAYNVIDICWCQILDRFLVVGENSFVTVHAPTMTRETVTFYPRIKLFCCTCSGTQLYVSDARAGSSIFIYELLPSIALVRQWESPTTCGMTERIEFMRYSNEKLALIILNTSEIMRLELRSSSTLDKLWLLNLGPISPFYAFHICALPGDEWLLIDQTRAQLSHINPNGRTKASTLYQPRCCSAELFGSDLLAISTDYRIFLHKI